MQNRRQEDFGQVKEQIFHQQLYFFLARHLLYRKIFIDASLTITHMGETEEGGRSQVSCPTRA
jgi:hypothetical protein